MPRRNHKLIFAISIFSDKSTFSFVSYPAPPHCWSGLQSDEPIKMAPIRTATATLALVDLNIVSIYFLLYFSLFFCFFRQKQVLRLKRLFVFHMNLLFIFSRELHATFYFNCIFTLVIESARFVLRILINKYTCLCSHYIPRKQNRLSAFVACVRFFFIRFEMYPLYICV